MAKKPKLLRDLSDVRSKIGNEYWRAGCSYIKYFENEPINDKAIFLESQHGKEFSGMIYYILKHLVSDPDYADFEINLSAWGNGNADRYAKMIEGLGVPEGKVRVLTVSTKEYYRAVAYCKYLINDNTFLPFFIKRKGQVYLNTWHGTPLKTLGKSIINDAGNIGNTMRNFIFADYLLYPNEYTKDIMVRDYMLPNLCRHTQTIIGGYPRNSVFFDTERPKQIRAELLESEDFDYKHVYAYMPTYRGTARSVGSSKGDTYMFYNLYELDKLLHDDEILCVNLHPIAKKNLDFRKFTHIRPFPAQYETYEFLNSCDALVTDYSSVFFDFACSRRKIVLFPFDKDEYFEDRGTYMPLEELPFPQPMTIKGLLKELRTRKNYDDTAFLDRFCRYDSPDAAKQLLDRVILGRDTGLKTERITGNGKENVLIYAGNLDRNGITASLRSLLDCIDCTERNYYISFSQAKSARNFDQLETFNKGAFFFPIADHINLTAKDKSNKILFSKRIIKAKTVARRMKKRFMQNFVRMYGGAKFDTVISFNGYENEIMLTYSVAPAKKAVFVHSDMTREIKTRGNQRPDVLKYVYNRYDKVCAVSENIIDSVKKIAGKSNDNITVVRNTIDYRSVLEKGAAPIELDPFTRCTVSPNTLHQLLESDKKKFINIGRFSQEKGHLRLIKAFERIHKEDPETLLFIVGGNSLGDTYDKLCETVEEMGLSDSVVLILNVSNPYAILNACDYFVLSSYYEGFGLVLAEADILGKPVISTDNDGPRSFMQQNGGVLVENSAQGLLDGMKRLLSGEIKPMNVDYETYNRECVAEFEKIFE
ncbi:MAG: CDP-glycerol glycerophosphotransferase family protein [Ruminococcus sp.]|nr:CDP-glycerol glycerophosphotransferase family protein [Ruminococcus sp.]